MKTLKSIAVIGAALLVCAGASAQAQTITWDPATTITTDTDVATNGSLVEAYYYDSGAGGTDVVNGVTFTDVTGVAAGFTSATSDFGVASYSGSVRSRRGSPETVRIPARRTIRGS